MTPTGCCRPALPADGRPAEPYGRSRCLPQLGVVFESPLARLARSSGRCGSDGASGRFPQGFSPYPATLSSRSFRRSQDSAIFEACAPPLPASFPRGSEAFPSCRRRLQVRSCQALRRKRKRIGPVCFLVFGAKSSRPDDRDELSRPITALLRRFSSNMAIC
jgi:hypothetical protein